MIYTIGNMIGSLFTGPICDSFGRRAGMATGSVLIMIGAAVQTAAKNDSYLLGGRFVLGFGVSIGTSAAPTYALELAPPQWRARVVGYYNTCEQSLSIASCRIKGGHFLTFLFSFFELQSFIQVLSWLLVLRMHATRQKDNWRFDCPWRYSSFRHSSS